MPDVDNGKVPDPKAGWFSRLPRRTQALLLALLMFVSSAVFFWLALHDFRAGEPLTNMAGRSDWAGGFYFAALAFVLGAMLLAVAFGWRPENSKRLSSLFARFK